MWSLPLMVNAFRAGTIVAVLAGSSAGSWCCAGRPSPGTPCPSSASPARRPRCLGVGVAYGYFGFCMAAALVIALPARARPAGVERRRVRGHRHGPGFRSRAAATSSSPSTRAFSTAHASAVRQFPRHHHRPGARLLAVAAVAVLPCWPPIGRPLLFASIDPDVARSPRGAGPVRSASRSWCCSVPRSPRSARSPARCWCSRCW